MPKSRTVFICQNCGAESPKWLGRCPDCDQWNTYVETILQAPSPDKRPAAKAAAVAVSHLEARPLPRISTGISEFDRVLGGGLVPGAAVLLGGDPGIGKSTLLLQAADLLAGQGRQVWYVSGEESVEQIKLRADRLGVRSASLYLLAETSLETILDHLDAARPDVAIFDSIQTLASEQIPGLPGGVSQVRECAQAIIRWAKTTRTPVFIVGHVTKEGTIAGPRIIEHLVDVVLYLEGDRYQAYRVLRGVKNRFGSTNEIGVFEMGEQGLTEVANPSLFFLAERNPELPGCVVTATLEGTRPLLVEVQALTAYSTVGIPRRVAHGIDPNRLILLGAVLTRRAGLALSNQDIYVNVTGGLRVEEPAVDLAVVLAIVSSFKDRPLRPDLVVFGEVGLGGELRRVAQVERRLTEALRLGFRACLLPAGPTSRVQGIELIPARTVRDAIRLALE